jgi:hypothetical protein
MVEEKLWNSDIEPDLATDGEGWKKTGSAALKSMPV